MPICKNCNIRFPNKLVIDGIKRTLLSSRKYCINCSPFGKHNTRPFDYIKVSPAKRECVICNKPYIGTGTECAVCQVNNRRFARKDKAVAYLGSKCYKCGYYACVGALAFHHTNPSNKLFSISGNYARSWEVLQAELDKCVLVCMNCHAEEHYNETENKRQIVRQRLKDKQA